MKEKHVFLTSLFYIIGSSILLLFIVSGSVFLITMAIVYRSTDPQNGTTIVLAIVFTLITVFMTYMLGISMFQWTIIDENKIRSRNFFKTILEVQWSDIMEVVLVKFNLSGAGTAVKWFVLKDKDEEIKQKNGVMNKDTFITIRYSKRAVRVIRIYWKDKITNLDN